MANPASIEHKDSDRQFASAMLSGVAFIRAFEQKILDLSQSNPPQIAGSIHLCAGQEVVPIAAMAALNDDDQVIATYRGHGWALASGLDPYAVFAEICHRESGINQGRGGSAYLMGAGHRFIGENSIVGAGTTMACGVALTNLAQGNGRVVIVTIGDGALNQGSVHEAMAFASAKELPVIFVVENNGWSELTATSDMFRIDRLAQRARGYGMPSATMDGTNASAVHGAVAEAARRARAGEGPSLLEFKVPRLWGHYNRDVEHYRGKDDKAAAAARDPLVTLRAEGVAQGFFSDNEASEILSAEQRRVDAIADGVMNDASADVDQATAHVVSDPAASPEAPGVIETKDMSYIQAVNTALRDILESDANAILYGEDVGKSGGIFQAARYLQRDFGAERVFDTPIAENAILGSAVGAAMTGLRPIVEIMWGDFMFVALDQLVNQAANVRYITGGKQSVPMVVRVQQGVTPGSCAQHSQSTEAVLAHFPGLKVALAATANDAYELLRAAAADPDPCIIIEARGLYPEKGDVQLTKDAGPVGTAKLRREGRDVGIVSWGNMVPRALEAAEMLAEKGINAGVLDLRWLNPLDMDALSTFARETSGKIVVAHEAVRTGGFGAEIIARLHELRGPGGLHAKRVAAQDSRIPANPVWQSRIIPDASAIVEAAREVALI